MVEDFAKGEFLAVALASKSDRRKTPAETDGGIGREHRPILCNAVPVKRVLDALSFEHSPRGRQPPPSSPSTSTRLVLKFSARCRRWLSTIGLKNVGRKWLPHRRSPLASRLGHAGSFAA